MKMQIVPREVLMIKLSIKPGSYDKIKLFQKEVMQKGINIELDTKDGLKIMFNNTNLKTVLETATKLGIKFDDKYEITNS